MNDVITIKKATSVSRDAYGNETLNFETKEAFCQVKSITRSEFYQAANTGLKPELIVEVYLEDYEEGMEIIYKGITYTVIKTYIKTPDIIEITCGRKMAND